MDKKIKISELCKKAEDELNNKNYSQSTINSKYKRVWKSFIEFTDDSIYSPIFGSQFILHRFKLNKPQDVKNLSKSHKYEVRAINMLETFYLFDTVFKKEKKIDYIKWPKEFKFEVELFIDDLNKRGISEGHYERNIMVLQSYIKYLNKQSISKIQAVRSKQNTEYISTLFGYSSSYINTIISVLRVFYRFLYHKKIIPYPLHDDFPRVKIKAYEKIPQKWSQDDISKILSCINRESPIGKRDYAMILLITKYAMRIGDVQTLEFSNIDLVNNAIIKTQNKTKSQIKFPLFNDIIVALSEYIEFGRPDFNSNKIFLKHTTPVGEFSTNNNFYSIFNKYRRNAGIEIEKGIKSGMHSLRHSLASELVQSGVDVRTIKDILGHSSVQSTLQYIRVDIEKLRLCALNVEDIGNEK